MNISPLTLEGRYVRLEPLSLGHVGPLCEVGLDPELWRWTASVIRTAEEMRTYIEVALRWQQEGKALPFVQIDRFSGTIVGSTRYGNIDRFHRRVEIGWTWISPRWQRTSLNTDAKYLLLRHAFESLACVRVEFKTDALNVKSRTALLRIGAKEEGTLRKHMITATGRVRDSVYYSITDEEWPDVKERLEGLLERETVD